MGRTKGSWTGIKNPRFKHGMTNHPLYTVWCSMRQRCNDKNCIDYLNYGGRGITYDKSWGFFKNFYDDLLPIWKEGLTIDRIDVNGNYSKTNCRFVDRIIQARNRRNTRQISFKDKLMTLKEWADFLSIKRSTLAQRIYTYKWPIER